MRKGRRGSKDKQEVIAGVPVKGDAGLDRRVEVVMEGVDGFRMGLADGLDWGR